eukprot:229857_1
MAKQPYKLLFIGALIVCMIASCIMYYIFLPQEWNKAVHQYYRGEGHLAEPLTKHIKLVATKVSNADFKSSDIWDIFKTSIENKYEWNENPAKDILTCQCGSNLLISLYNSNYFNSANISFTTRLYNERDFKVIKRKKKIYSIDSNTVNIIYGLESPFLNQMSYTNYLDFDLIMRYTFSQNTFYSDIHAHDYMARYPQNVYNYYLGEFKKYVSFENKNKNADVAWMGGNCDASNGREIYLKELFKYIKYHSYGKCLNNIKDENISQRKELYNDNINSFVANYKFFIIVENANCIDYITEKLGKRTLIFNAIPILFMENDIPNYNVWLPNNSYINIADFKSAKELGEYINKVANNKTLWNSYFWFRKNITVYNNFVNNLKQYPIIHKQLNDNYSLLCDLAQTIEKYNKSNAIKRNYSIIDQKEECMPRHNIVKYINR